MCWNASMNSVELALVKRNLFFRISPGCVDWAAVKPFQFVLHHPTLHQVLHNQKHYYGMCICIVNKRDITLPLDWIVWILLCSMLLINTFGRWRCFEKRIASWCHGSKIVDLYSSSPTLLHYLLRYASPVRRAKQGLDLLQSGVFTAQINCSETTWELCKPIPFLF